MVLHLMLAFLHVWLHVDFLGCCFHIGLILCMLVCLMRFFFCFMHVGFVSQWMFSFFDCVVGCLWMFFCGVHCFSYRGVFVSCMFTLFHIECCFHFLHVDFFSHRGVFVSCMLSFILEIWNVVCFPPCLVSYGCFWVVLVICCLWMFPWFFYFLDVWLLMVVSVICWMHSGSILQQFQTCLLSFALMFALCV